jgi:hypothetical protein
VCARERREGGREGGREPRDMGICCHPNVKTRNLQYEMSRAIEKIISCVFAFWYTCTKI